MVSKTHMPLSASELRRALQEARRRTLALVHDLDDDQLLGPRLAIVNPLLWEIGHVAWFQERWTRRHLRGLSSLLEKADDLYDSMAVAHDLRWDLELVGRNRIVAYMERTLEDTLEHLTDDLTDEQRYFHLLALFHEDMHGEAFAYTRQTLGYPAPDLAAAGLTVEPPPVPGAADRMTGDVRIEGGTYELGAPRDLPFVFDNEKWAHPVTVETFRMAPTAVTQGQFLAFVEDGGYRRPEVWSEGGWRWLSETGAKLPVHWRQVDASWCRRDYDRWVQLENRLPMVHVSWYEAEAYCRWAGRRLPTEAEWELAASTYAKTTFPWGKDPSAAGRANLDGTFAGPIAVNALAAGDTASGLRQMMGNVWEWTSDDFSPYPGFVADPYKDYSQPWFGDHKVLRGGCWATRFHMLRNTWRNFYTPDRRDVWAGFRTCSKEKS